MNNVTPIAIFGGLGYLGRALGADLSQKQIDYWVIGRQSARDPLLPGEGRYRSAEPSLEQAVSGASTVFHFASLTTPAIGQKKPLLDVENIALTLSLIDACVKAKVRHLIFASSGGTVYGEASQPLSEEAPTLPMCSYGIAKLASERYLEFFSKSTGLNVTILRMSNVYGGAQVKKGDQGVIRYLAEQISSDKEVSLLGDTIRDYIFVDDVISAFQRATEKPAGFQIFNISTGVGTSLVSLTKLVFSSMGKKENIVMSERRPFDVAYNVLNNKKARERLSWIPGHQLKECLPAYLKSHGFCP